MSQAQWKKFQFFEVSLLNADPSVKKSVTSSFVATRSASFASAQEEGQEYSHLSEILNMKFAECVMGLFYIGLLNGSVYICFHDEVRFRFQAHSHQMLFMSRTKLHPILVTVGLDKAEQGNRGVIKCWDVSSPESRDEIASIALPDNVITSACCFALSEDMTRLAIGMRTGQIFILQGDILNGGKALNKKMLTPFEKKTPITNLFFMPKGRNYCLFFSTMVSIGSFILTPKGEEMRILDEQDGCSTGCADLEEKKERLVIGMSNLNAVTLFYPEFRGPTWSFEGEKIMIRCFKANVIVVSVIKNQHQVAIYDIDNKFISFLSTYTQVDHILSEEEAIYIITRNTKKEIIIQKLVEKDNTEKMAILFKKNMYDIAYSIAKQEGYDDTFMAEISRMQGDHYYNKGDFDNAINCYKQTVGFLEPSYVIIQFLDASKIEYLTSYLEHLHNKHHANNEHTALLLNCYVHLKATEQLNKFLAQSEQDYELFDPKTAIDVCCEAKCFELALNLADRFKMYSTYVKIKVEDMKCYKEALEYMREKMSLSGIAKCLKEFGQKLMDNERYATRDMIFNIISEIPARVNLNTNLPESDKDEKPRGEVVESDEYILEDKSHTTPTYKQVLESIMSALVNNQDILEDLLLTLIQRTPDIDEFIYHKLFELYLQQRRQVRGLEALQIKTNMTAARPASMTFDSKRFEDKIKNLLESANNRYDKNHVLMLFQMYDYNEGVVSLSKLMDNKQELMYHYIKNHDYDNIWLTCQKYARNKKDLWVQALTYFSNRNDDMAIEYIKKILQQIEHSEHLSPLIVLEILSKNAKISFGAVKNYFKKQLVRHRREMESDDKGKIYSELKNNTQMIEQMKREIYELKTSARKFQSSKCANCEGKLQLPSVHFMCMHSYHQHCLTDNERECQRCSEDSLKLLEKKSELQVQSSNNEMFFKELEGATDRFGLISKYFSRGLFSTN